MVRAEPRLETANERLIGEQRIEIDGCPWHANTLSVHRYAAVKIGERRAVPEPFGLGSEAIDEVQQPAAAADKELEPFLRIGAAFRLAFLAPRLCSRSLLGGRPPAPGAVVRAHKH